MAPIAIARLKPTKNDSVSTIEGRSVADPWLPHRSSEDLEEHDQAE
jgi:hypothetical protein